MHHVDETVTLKESVLVVDHSDSVYVTILRKEFVELLLIRVVWQVCTENCHFFPLEKKGRGDNLAPPRPKALGFAGTPPGGLHRSVPADTSFTCRAKLSAERRAMTPAAALGPEKEESGPSRPECDPRRENR